MSENRFSLEYYGNMPYVKDNSNDNEYYLYWAVELMNELYEENEQLRQKKHWVYVDVDNANGCMNCKYNISNICSILDCGTHDYLVGVSECGLKYWESLI